MARSEQLDTRLWLAADATTARGLLLQRMPGTGGVQTAHADGAETWQRLLALATTLQRPELLATGIDTLRHRLFWEETIRLFEPLQPQFHCSCSREKVGNMLKMLGVAEVQSALDELGQLGIDCDFCGRHYDFDKVDCAQLFASEAPAEALLPPGDARH